jgi:two-component system response regulator AtoC
MGDEQSYLMIFERNTSWRYPLPADGEVVVGRADTADLRLSSASVSRKHARIRVEDGAAQIVDLGSHNGVAVNGAPIEGEKPLASRDVVSLGNVTLIFYSRVRPQPREAATVEAILARAAELSAPYTMFVLDLASRNVDHPAVEAALPEGYTFAWEGGERLVALAGVPEERAAGEVARLKEALADVAPPRVGVSSSAGVTPPAEVLAAARAAASDASRPRAAEAARVIEVPGGRLHIADPAMLRLFRLLERLAATDVPLLVGGEPGTGKKLAAAAVHEWSARRDRPFLSIALGAVAGEAAERALLGAAGEPGLLEAAGGGTVFLEEIGELSLGLQARLARVLETRKVTRAGDEAAREIDARVIAATGRDLEADVRAGRFRQDLYFRLSGGTVWLPPLRDRPREILMLAEIFAGAAAGGRAVVLSAATEQALLRHAWPGNVRELRVVMEAAAAAAGDGPIEPRHLPVRLHPAGELPALAASVTLDGPWRRR